MTSALYVYFAAFSPQEWAGIAIPVLILVPCLAWALTSASVQSRIARTLRQGAGLRTDRPLGQNPSEPKRWPRSGRRRADQTVAPANLVLQDPAPALRPNAEAVPENIPGAVAVTPEPGVFNRRCKMDLAATRDGLELTVELPGVEEKDVNVQLIDDVLTISGHVSFEPDREEKNYRLIERDFGGFSRSIELPEGVAPDKIRATLTRGLLRVTIPNPTRPKPKLIPVQGQPMHMAETVDGYELTVDMPGLEEGDIEVTVTSSQLTIREDMRPQSSRTASCVGSTEHGHGRTLHSVDLPAQVDPDLISAVLSNGVLKVTLPSLSQPNLRKIAVRAAA